MCHWALCGFILGSWCHDQHLHRQFYESHTNFNCVALFNRPLDFSALAEPIDKCPLRRRYEPFGSSYATDARCALNLTLKPTWSWAFGSCLLWLLSAHPSGGRS